MKRRLLLIINARSGTAAIKNRLLDVIELFVIWEFDVTVHTTRHKGDAADQIRSRASDFDVIVCCGGDGTINEAFSVLSSMKDPPPLGVIPSGTTNDFAHSLSIPVDPIDAAQAICVGKPFICDCGVFGGRAFTYAAAFGVFTNITYETPQENKNQLGRAAYVIEAIKSLPSYEPYHVRLECDKGNFEGDYILGMATNTISIAGFRNIFQSVADLGDGFMEISLVKMPKTLAEYQKVINILVGIERVEYVVSDFLTVVPATWARVSSDKDISWTVDGEEGGIHRDVEIEMIPRAVPIIIAEDMMTRPTI